MQEDSTYISTKEKDKRKEQSTERKFLWIAVALAIIGCLAPILFTRTKLFECLDFSNTGQIGDTIGGTMTPIVSLAAVILTYLAFRKQVEANKIQTEQFNETLKQKEKDDKKQLWNSLELMSLDVDFVIQDMEERINQFKDYLKNVREITYGERILRNIPTVSLSRYRTIDRNKLYNAYKLFVDYEDKKELFRRTYFLLDYYSEKSKEVLSTLEKDFKQSNQLHDKISGEFENFENLVKLLDSTLCDKDLVGVVDYTFDKSTTEFFHKAVFQYPDKNLHLFLLDVALKTYDADFAKIHDERIKRSFSELKKLMSDLKSVNEYIVSEIKEVEKTWSDKTLKELWEIRDVLHTSLEKSYDFN